MAVNHILSDQQFEQLLSSAGSNLVVIDFYATWCPPCRNIAPLLDSLAAQYKGKTVVMKVDVDKQADLSSKYDISSLPTFVFIKNGKIVNKLVGADEVGLKKLFAQLA